MDIDGLIEHVLVAIFRASWKILSFDWYTGYHRPDKLCSQNSITVNSCMILNWICNGDTFVKVSWKETIKVAHLENFAKYRFVRIGKVRQKHQQEFRDDIRLVFRQRIEYFKWKPYLRGLEENQSDEREKRPPNWHYINLHVTCQRMIVGFLVRSDRGIARSSIGGYCRDHISLIVNNTDLLDDTAIDGVILDNRTIMNLLSDSRNRTRSPILLILHIGAPW